MMADGMMHGMYGGMGWWWFVNVLFGILIIVGIVLLTIWLIQRYGKQGEKTGESAFDILKKRYASGEITKAEYESMKKDIS